MTRASRHELLWLAVVGLLVQAFWAVRLEHPSYFDAYYYTGNAYRLATGEGFAEEIIWHYLDDPAGLPSPSHTYWMPLASIVGAAGYVLTGTFRGAQLPFWLIAGVALPLMSYAINWRLAGERWQARMAALLTAAGGYYAAYWNQPTTFALFGLLAGGCLLALALAHSHSRRAHGYWFLAGLSAGLAHLTRADGVLLLGIGGAIWIWPALFSSAPSDATSFTQRLRFLRGRLPALLLFVAGYLLPVAPWLWRNWRLTGAPLSGGGAETIFLTTYNDLFAYERSFDLQSYLAWGWWNIVRSKLEALWLAVQTFVAVTGLTAFTFFAVVGWVHASRREAARFLRPVTLYTLALFAVMSLVFTFPGQRGSLLHSSTAIWPWSMALVPLGISLTVHWIAARRAAWRPHTASRLFAAVFLFMVYLITLIVAGGQPLRQEEAAIYRAVGRQLGPDAVVMVGDPASFHYHTGLPALVVPNEPPAITLNAARRYGVSHLLLDANTPPPLKALYEGQAPFDPFRLVAELDHNFRLYQIVEGE